LTTDKKELIVPGYDPSNPKPYPGDIKPGSYPEATVKKLLKKHKNNPEALQFAGYTGGMQ